MIYDHQLDAESGRGRPVADWGGDELFTSTPRRRGRHAAARPRRNLSPVTGSHAVRRGVEPQGGRPGEAPVPSGPAAVRLPEPLPLRPAAKTGIAAARPGAPSGPRRRPQPTVQERIGTRPDRIAGWAFGLGITLIMIAVGTADGGIF